MAATTSAADDPGILIASAASGDLDAFATIVARHHDDMRRVCLVVTGEETITDEAVAAAWAIAWRKIGGISDPQRLKAWLVSVAVNEARQLLRSRRRRALVEIPIAADADPRGGPDPATAIQTMDLRNALARLSADDRALIALRYLAGFDAAELARATGRSPSGTRARLGRILARLERELVDD